MEKQVKQSQETNSCSVGCKDCNYNSQCLQCMDGFDLYQNNCIFQNCLEGLFFYEGMQNQNQTLGTCVAVCPQQYIQSFSQNTCNRIESCTLSYSTEIKKDQCIINELKQLPQDLKQFLLKEQEFNIIQFMNSISIIDNQLVEIQSLTFSPQAILKLIIVSNLDETYIIFLLDNYFVQQVQLQIVSQGLQLQQVNQIPVLTSNPKYLIYLPAITQQNISDRLLIIGNDIQSEILISKNKTQNTEKQRYIVSNSNFQYEDFKSQIQFTLIIDNINIMVNCVNQAIYIWDISEIYNPVYIFSIKNSNSQCLEIYYLSNYDILIVYQNQINVFQINKFYLKQLWNLNSTSQGFIPKVSIYQQKCAIVFNQALYLYELDSERLIPFQFSNYTEHIQFISLQNNNLLIIQYQQQCSQFYINYQTNTTQLIKKFQTNSQIIKSKIRTYANNTFELNIYTSINSFIILNQDFTLILQIQKIPFLQLFDFSFLESDPTDNSYFLLGQTTQVSASSQYIGYYFTKSIPTLTQAWSATSGIKIINVEKLQSNLLQTTYIAQVLFNQNAYSAIFSFIYQPSKPKLNVGNFYFNFYQYQYLQENTYLTNQKQNLISCDVNGLIGVNQNTRSFYNILYSMSSSELQVQKNPIMDVIQNYNLGIVLVVKSLNILQFDIFTNQLIKNIQFGISNSTIIQYQLYKSKSSFISCKTDTLYLQLIDLKKEYTFQTQLLNGFTLWKQDNQDFIITYGQSITILSFELQNNQMLISTQGAQIYIYDILQQSLITIISSQSQSTQGSIYVGMYFDQEFYQITTLSQSGVLYSLSYQNFQSPQQLTKYIEFDTAQTPYAKGMYVDQITNLCFLFSDQYVLKADYSRFTNIFKQLSLEKNKFATKIIYLNQNNYAYYILTGQNNTLYTYQNFQIQYFGLIQSQNQIVDIQYLEDNQLVIVAFIQEIRVYNFTQVKFQSNSLIENMPYQQEIQFQINQFLCPYIFITIDNIVVHYDFKSMEVIQKLALSSILSKFYINKQKSILTLGLSNGDIILYFIQTQQQLNYSLNIASNKNNIKFILETNKYIWIGSLNSYLICFDVINNKQQFQINLNTYSNNTLSELTALAIDEDNTRLFFGYLHQKIVYSLNYSTINSTQNQKYLLFPGTQSNNIEITQNYIIIYSTFQFNFHDRSSLQFILTVRRQNIADAVNKIYIVKEQFFLLFSTYKYELIFIDFQNQNYQILDQVQINHYQIIDIVYSENENRLNLITTINNQLYEKNYQLSYYLQQIIQNKYECSLVFQDATYFQMTNKVNSIYPIVQQQSNTLGINILQNINSTKVISSQINNPDFSEINLQLLKSSQLIITPNSNISAKQELIITEELFANYPLTSIQLNNFNFIIKGNLINFDSNISEVFLQNIEISNQNLSNVQIILNNLDKVVIQNLIVQNITISQLQNSQSFLIFENCNLVTIQNLTIQNMKFYGKNSSYFFSIKNIKRSNIQNIIIKNSNLNNSFMFLQELQVIKLNQIEVNQCKNENNQTDINYFITSQGIQTFLINSAQFLNNQNILFISYRNQYILDFQKYQIQDDQIIMQVSNVSKNSCIDKSLQLIKIQAANLGCHSLQIEQISRLSQEQEQKIQFFYNDLKKQSLSSESQYLGTLFITNLKSGENIKIAVSIIDEEGNKFILSQDSFLNKNLMSELNQFTFQLQSVSEQKLQLNGQTLINIDSYDFNSDQFLFNQVIITSSPNTQNYLLMNYQINSHIQFPILIQVQFRNCKQGEVLKHQIFQLYSCQECQIGTYSLAKYDNQNTTNQTILSQYQQTCNDIKISLLTIQNSFLTQSKLSNSPITPNRTAFSHVLTNSVYHLQKKQTLKSHFGTTNQAKEQKANLRDEYNFVTQNTQIQDTQYMFNRNNTNEIVFPNQNFKESEQYQENHLKEQNQFQEWLIPIYHNTLQTRKSQQNQNNNKQMNSQWFKNWILKQIISLALIRISVNQLSQFNQNCGLGCMECIKSFNCIKCIQGYQLQQGVCAYSNCPQGMFYQLDSNNLNKNIGQCVAICNNSYYQCTSQNSCFKVEQCPLSFQSEFIFNDGELNIQERLLIVGEGIQSVILSNIYNNTINTEKQQYLIQNYEFSFDQISGLIQNTLVIDQINYLVSCAAEGVFVWDISHIYKFKYLFSIKQNDAQCLELYHLQNYDILITYNSKILILNLSQFIIKQEWAINQIYQSTIPKISVQSSFILPEDQLLIQLVNEILLYQLDLNTFNSEAKFYFMTQANILMTKIRYYSQQYFEVNIYTQDQSFIILNQQLQIILLINKIPLLSLNDFQFMNNTNDDSYYFLGKTSQINSSFSTVVLCIFKSDPQIYLAIQTTGGQQIVSIQQQLNNSSVFYYLITLLINKPTYSSVIQFQYFPKTKTFYFYNGFYQLNKNQQLSYFVNRNQNQISTFSNGFIGSHQNMQFFQQQIYISKDQNMVVDIIQNYKMGITFVIKQSSFVVFNLFTNILIEEVFFGNQEDMIINYYFIQENNVFTACKKDVLITKDYHTYNNNNTQQIDIINGYIVYRVSNQSYLIAYGQQIQLFNLNLTLIHTILNQQEGLIISSCKEISSNLYCKAQQQQGTKPLLIIFDLINYQILQKILSIDSDSNFQFQVDLENQNIFIFKDYLQIFSFQGQQVEKISNFKEEISSLDLYGQYIILLQSSSQSYITIFDRKTFLFVHEFVIQTQGYIVCNLIVEQYNHLLISIDNIQMGQIFVYDLSKMTFVTSIFNYFPSNNPNIVQSLIYDKDFNLLNFLDKTGINGGALFIENNSKQINILNSRFLGNTAKANGGAIYFKEQQGIINIDKYCSIKYNHAQIGGGFRIQNSDFYLYSYELLGLVQQLDISNNTADISGQNYKFGLSSIEVVSISSDSSDNQPIQYYFKNNQNINQDQYSGQLNILSLKSGVKLNIALGLKDEENNLLVFKTDTYKSNQYQTDIQNELSQISFSLQSINQQQIQLEGQITILTDSFQSEINSFVFNQVTISGQPLGFGCQYCQLGFYSLESFNNYNISYISSQSIQPSCQQCPASADQCQKSTILIKQGYWRIGKHSDKIILCINNPLNCQEQDVSSINGCIQGYIGPLCEECDIFGVIWQKRYTKKSFSQYECTLCPSLTGQIVYISGVIIFVIITFQNIENVSYEDGKIIKLDDNCLSNAIN
ncbi:hypothetical protein ABPG73_000529 [Tetrahymena malaccensis]